MDEETRDALLQRLEELRIEHRDLDESVRVEEARAYVDQLRITRLKRRKLVLKDAIARLESLLIPNLNA